MGLVRLLSVRFGQAGLKNCKKTKKKRDNISISNAKKQNENICCFVLLKGKVVCSVQSNTSAE